MKTFLSKLWLPVVLLLLISLLISPLGAKPVLSSSKVSSAVLNATVDGGSTSFIIYLEDQADVSAAYQIADWNERGWYVYNTLQNHALQTQAPIIAQLQEEGAAFTPFWAANIIIAEGDRGVVEALAARSDVRAIESNETSDWIQDEGGVEAVDEGNEVYAIEGGLNQANAPALWNLGYKGQGIVVANQDTGMRWTHAALINQYRGYNAATATANHNYSWWDAIHFQLPGSPATNSCGRNAQAPCDDNGHGTHTTGTVVGFDGGTNQIGVAPDAKWIGCRNMDAGNGRPYTYAECFQFFIAPTDLAGQNVNPALRPHVMNNSWGCPPSEECAANTLYTIVRNTRAAGIFVVVSAGNAGSACSTVNVPPSIYDTVFSVGSITSTNALSSFSSRGPVSVDGSGRMKPDIVARGGTVRSATRASNTTYGSMSGTSMAGPHVAGAVALLWSALPNLKGDIPRTEYLLTRSANPAVTVPNNAAGCGGIGSIPNNHFGWGRVDSLAAYNLEPSLYQTINFPAIANKIIGEGAFDPGATASSGLPVRYSASGSCSIVDGMVQLNSVGSCTVTADQDGLAEYRIALGAPVPYYPAASTSQTFNITYQFTGFTSPVDNPPFINTANSGQAIPLKWRVTDFLGNPITNLNGVSVSVVSVACPLGQTDDAITEYAPGSSGLINQGNGYYHYNWATPKSYAKSCKKLFLDLGEGVGSERTAEFKFVK